MRSKRDGLWAHADFLKLWGAQTISLLGSQVGGLAVSLTAVLALGATAGQVGLLRAAAFAPPLLFSLVAGVWADRARRRPILIAADLGSALLLLSIPIVAFLGMLRIEQLYAVNFLTGALANLFQVAYGAFLPAVVGRGRLVAANGKLELSRSVAQIGGPGLGGALVGLLTAPVAVVVDALSFLGSALLLGLIRRPESPAPPAARQGVLADIREGLRLVGGDPLLRALAGSTSTGNFFATVSSTALILFMARELGLAPAAIGLVLGAIGPGSLLGALLAPRLPARLGLGRTVVAAVLLLHGGNLLQAFAGGSAARAAATLAIAQFTIGLTAVILNVNLLSLSQAITPDRLQGRLRATLLFVSAGATLAGGALGEALGLRPTLLVGGIGGFVGALWIVLSPLRILREQPLARRDDRTPG